MKSLFCWYQDKNYTIFDENYICLICIISDYIIKKTFNKEVKGYGMG